MTLQQFIKEQKILHLAGWHLKCDAFKATRKKYAVGLMEFCDIYDKSEIDEKEIEKSFMLRTGFDVSKEIYVKHPNQPFNILIDYIDIKTSTKHGVYVSANGHYKYILFDNLTYSL